jgi:isopentenyldiphosphate isomerase
VAEHLEVYTRAGDPTGVVKTRAAIHADGDWHVAAFIWVYDGRGRVLLQRRSPDKDVWPERWDASAAGHVQAGEPIDEAAQRELAEEIGLEIDRAALMRAEDHFEEHVHANGMIDREIHAVFFVRSDAPLDAYRPGPEVTAIAWVDAEALRAFARSNADALDVVARTAGSAEASPTTLRRADLVVYQPDYLAHVAERVLGLLAGTSSAK